LDEEEVVMSMTSTTSIEPEYRTIDGLEPTIVDESPRCRSDPMCDTIRQLMAKVMARTSGRESAGPETPADLHFHRGR
jgi:hypothetical protein